MLMQRQKLVQEKKKMKIAVVAGVEKADYFKVRHLLHLHSAQLL